MQHQDTEDNNEETFFDFTVENFKRVRGIPSLKPCVNFWSYK
jgi:hypothetical protein